MEKVNEPAVVQDVPGGEVPPAPLPEVETIDPNVMDVNPDDVDKIAAQYEKTVEENTSKPEEESDTDEDTPETDPESEAASEEDEPTALANSGLLKDDEEDSGPVCEFEGYEFGHLELPNLYRKIEGDRRPLSILTDEDQKKAIYLQENLTKLIRAYHMKSHGSSSSSETEKLKEINAGLEETIKNLGVSLKAVQKLIGE